MRHHINPGIGGVHLNECHEFSKHVRCVFTDHWGPSGTWGIESQGIGATSVSHHFLHALAGVLGAQAVGGLDPGLPEKTRGRGECVSISQRNVSLIWYSCSKLQGIPIFRINTTHTGLVVGPASNNVKNLPKNTMMKILENTYFTHTG